MEKQTVNDVLRSLAFPLSIPVSLLCMPFSNCPEFCYMKAWHPRSHNTSLASVAKIIVYEIERIFKKTI